MRKVANFRFVYPVLFGLIFGILSSLFCYREDFVKIGLFLAVFFLAYGLIFSHFKLKLFIHLGVFILFFVIGFLIMYFTIRHYLNLQLPNGVYQVSGKITAVRYYQGKSVLTLNATLKSGYSLDNAKIHLLVNTTSLEIGDSIKCFANITFVENDFIDTYYLSERIPCTGEVISGTLEYLGTSRNLFENVNIFIKNAVYENMSADPAGICYALLTGSTSGIDASISQAYRFSGVFHIFSVSGLHISFLAHLIFKLTKKINIPQIIKSIAVILIITFYCGVCSFVACALRSVIMCSFMLLTGCFGKKYDILNSTLLSACVLLIINPFNLLNIGFLLSYLSVIGIICLTRPIARAIKFIPGKIGESIAVSVAATLSTLPVTLNVFGYFSPMSILYNLLIVPIVYVVFLTLIVSVFFSILFSKVFLFAICEKGVLLTNKIVEITTPQRFIVKGSMIRFATVSYYTGIVTYSDLIFINKKPKLIISSILLVTSLVLAIII